MGAGCERSGSREKERWQRGATRDSGLRRRRARGTKEGKNTRALGGRGFRRAKISFPVNWTEGTREVSIPRNWFRVRVSLVFLSRPKPASLSDFRLVCALDSPPPPSTASRSIVYPRDVSGNRNRPPSSCARSVRLPLRGTGFASEKENPPNVRFQ